ncbi:MAG: SDR family oxidoreductase [Bacteroidetes bacterium]|nr:SDR family oxidoreductase [Bacteroidota bacterium]MBS1973078.1 SDR family oxidoreductase [Bacteroidota bacterium]
MPNIIITGASRGLGKAIAEKFAANNYHLYLTSRNEMALYKAMGDLQSKFPFITIKARAFDLTKSEEAKGFGNWILGQHASIDIVVNNAGSFLPGNVHDEKEGTLEAMISVNLYSAYHVTRALLPAMMKQPLSNGSRGHVFNMCSVASLKAYLSGGSYSISKFALAGFSKNLREEMMPHFIKVTAVYPGAAYTDSWAGSGIDEKRIMEARDIADMVFASSQLSPQATVEDIIIRPQLGDI